MGEKLTRRRIESWLRNPAGGEWLWCGELRGFGVQRRDSDSEAAFVAQFRVGTGRLAKRRRTVIGTFPTMTPEAARVAAGDLINAGRKGDDPVAVRRAEQAAAARKRDTYKSLGEVFWTERRKALRASSANLYESVWRRFIVPELGDSPVADTKRRTVAGLMDAISTEAGTSVADRAFVILSVFYKWYASRDDEFTSPLIPSMRRHTSGEGTRPMTDDELRQFWSACERAGLAGIAGRFCLLTATRRTETTSAQRSELVGADAWLIPAARYKGKRDHLVPLSATASALIRDLESPRYLFGATGSAPTPDRLWAEIVAAGGPVADGLSWHSLRKTARTLMSRCGVRPDYAERLLGHAQEKLERIYDRHDHLAEKRIAVEALAAEVLRVASGQELGNVVRLARQA